MTLINVKYIGDNRELQQSQKHLTREEFITLLGFDHPDIKWPTDVLSFPGIKKQTFDYEDKNNSMHSETLKGLSNVEFNITDLCNRHCWMCPHHNEDLFPNRNVYMKVSVVKAVVDDIVKHNYNNSITFGSYGEPLLHPNVVEMISYCSEKLPECPTVLFTNGDRLLKESIPGYGSFNAETLIDSGLNTLVLDSYDNDEKTAYYLQKLKPLFGTINIFVNLRYNSEFSRSYLTRAGLMDPMTGLAPSKKLVWGGACYWPITGAFIDFDGSLRSCCHNWSRELGSHGNVEEIPFSEVWMNSNSMNSLRKKLYKSRELDEVCKHCDAAGQTRSKQGRVAKNLWKDALSD